MKMTYFTTLPESTKSLWQGNLDISLNDKGIFQAETLSEGLAYKLKDKHVKLVFH